MYFLNYLFNKIIVTAKTTCGIRTVCTVRSLRQCIRIIIFMIGIGGRGAFQEAYAQGYMDNPTYSAPRGPIPIRDARPYNILFL